MSDDYQACTKGKLKLKSDSGIVKKWVLYLIFMWFSLQMYYYIPFSFNLRKKNKKKKELEVKVDKIIKGEINQEAKPSEIKRTKAEMAFIKMQEKMV